MALNDVVRQIFDDHVETLKATYKTRRDAMLSALEADMPDSVTWIRPEGGMFVWLTLPPHIDAGELLAQSLKTEKVAFVPGRAFYADGSNGNTLRLSYTCMTPEQIAEGVKRLARLIKA
jgi:DNA-binding transcriptional MocR family regulator